MKESSIEYSAAIEPGYGLRRVVLLSGIALSVAGAMMLVTLPVDYRARALLLLVWVLWGVREWRQYERAYRRFGAFRVFADGRVLVAAGAGEWHTTQLLPGSVIGRRIAWLRLRVEGFPAYAELVTGNPRESEDWRRLQVIWRHIGAVRDSC